MLAPIKPPLGGVSATAPMRHVVGGGGGKGGITERRAVIRTVTLNSGGSDD